MLNNDVAGFNKAILNDDISSEKTSSVAQINLLVNMIVACVNPKAICTDFLVCALSAGFSFIMFRFVYSQGRAYLKC